MRASFFLIVAATFALIFVLTFSILSFEPSDQLSGPPNQRSVTPDQLSETLDQLSIKKAQRLLITLGYAPGKVDGIASPRTAAAVREYQRRTGRNETGDISQTLINFLESSVASKQQKVKNKLFLTPDQLSEPPNLLGPGDRLAITVLDQPELSGEFEIDASGKIMFPLIGEVDAGKLTADALAKSLTEDLLNGYLKHPRVSAEIVKD